MEEADKIVLHYRMLEYLFEKCKLATSCFNHAWESFLIEYPEYENLLTSSELKNIFWTEIATNIEQYELLTEEQEEYFNYDGCILNISDENLIETLVEAEPRKDTDYVFMKTEENYRRLVPHRPRITDQNVQKVFKEPNVRATDSEIKLNIIGSKPPSSDIKNGFKLSCLMMNLLADGDNLSNDDEVINTEIPNRLRNTHLCTDFEHLGIDSDDWTRAIFGVHDENLSNSTENLPLMLPKPTINSTESYESFPSFSSHQSQPSLSILVPETSRTPTRLFTRSLSQTTPSSHSRRSALPSTSSRSTRSRKALVPDPALNLKMSKFIDKHKRKNK